MIIEKIVTGIVREIAEKTREDGFVYTSEEELNKLWGEDMDYVSFQKMKRMLCSQEHHILVARPCEVGETDKKCGANYVPSTYDAVYYDYRWLETEAKKTPMLMFPKIDIPDELRFFSIRVLEIYRRCLTVKKPVFIPHSRISEHFRSINTSANQASDNVLHYLRQEFGCVGLHCDGGVAICPLVNLGVPYVNG